MNREAAGDLVAGAERAAATVAPAPTTGVVARGVSWKMLSVVVGQGCWYASLFVLAILIGPNDFGVMAVGSAIVSFALLVLDSGTGGSLIIAADLSPASIRRSLVRTSLAGLLVMALFAALAQPIADAFAGGADAGVLRFMAVGIGLAAIAIVPNALLSKHLRFKAIAQIWIAAAAIGSAVAIVAAALGAGVWSLAVRIVVNQALLSGLAFLAARDLLPRRGPRGEASPPRRPGGLAFLTIATAAFVAWTADNLVVGAFTNPVRLGLYSLAFSLAFAPLTQVSWTVGQVLLPAIAAARDEELVRRQTLKAVRMMALLLLPLLPVAIALAPGLIPALLGADWRGMVLPFQVLISVGVGFAVLNTLGEALAGAGASSVAVRARIDAVWALGAIAAIALGADLDGIDGAAFAHIAGFAFLAVAYGLRGSRGIGLSVGSLLGAVGGVGGCVAAQAVVTAAVTIAVEGAGSGLVAGGIAGAVAGAAALAGALALASPDLLAEGRSVVGSALSGRRS